MFGPGLALRGPSGSMKEAVDAMKGEREMTYRFFKLGVFFIHVSGATMVWCYRASGDSATKGWIESTVVSVMLGVSCFYIYYHIERVHGIFRYEDQKSNMDIGGILVHKLQFAMIYNLFVLRKLRRAYILTPRFALV